MALEADCAIFNALLSPLNQTKIATPIIQPVSVTNLNDVDAEGVVTEWIMKKSRFSLSKLRLSLILELLFSPYVNHNS